MPLVYITILVSNEMFSPSNKIHREVDRAEDVSAPWYKIDLECKSCSTLTPTCKGFTCVWTIIFVQNFSFILWPIELYSLVGCYRCFDWIFSLHLQSEGEESWESHRKGRQRCGNSSLQRYEWPVMCFQQNMKDLLTLANGNSENRKGQTLKDQ
jgi:hypothetical protein